MGNVRFERGVVQKSHRLPLKKFPEIRPPNLSIFCLCPSFPVTSEVLHLLGARITGTAPTNLRALASWSKDNGWAIATVPGP